MTTTVPLVPRATQRVDNERKEDIRVLEQAGSRFSREHADDGMCGAVEEQRLSENGGVRGEPALPESAREKRHLICPGLPIREAEHRDRGTA